MIWIALVAATVIACELWLATRFLKVAQRMARAAALAQRTLGSRTLEDEQKEKRLLTAARFLLCNSMMAGALIVLYAFPFIVLALLMASSVDLLLQPLVMILLAVLAILYMLVRRKVGSS